MGHINNAVYITYLDLPAPGCWRLNLTWGAPQATAILYVDVAP